MLTITACRWLSAQRHEGRTLSPLVLTIFSSYFYFFFLFSLLLWLTLFPLFPVVSMHLSIFPPSFSFSFFLFSCNCPITINGHLKEAQYNSIAISTNVIVPVSVCYNRRSSRYVK